LNKSLGNKEDIGNELSDKIDPISLQIEESKGKVYLKSGRSKLLKFEKMSTPGPGQYNLSSSVIF
jgi:hypothetical protein